MKKLLTLTLLLLLVHNINGQTIRDSVFNDVILIKNTDVTTNGKDFLIDIPIKPQKDPIIIFNNDERIPTNLFFEIKSFSSEQYELFLITPDWEFRKEILEREKREGIHIKATRHKIYHIQRGRDNYQVDSLIINLHSKPITKLNFTKPELQKNELKVYYQECLGSSCCPKDPRWDYLKKGKSTIEIFEKQQNVKVIGLYKVLLGKEGEHCNYLTLDNLENSQKIVVLNLLKYISKLNKSEEQTSKIYIPNIVHKRI